MLLDKELVLCKNLIHRRDIHMRDMYRKMHLANVVGKYVNGSMKRRDFLKNAGMLGLGAGCLGTMGTMSRKFIPQAHAGSHIEWRGDMICLLYTSPSPRDLSTSRMPSSA